MEKTRIDSDDEDQIDRRFQVFQKTVYITCGTKY
jgi:hypothetical protein